MILLIFGICILLFIGSLVLEKLDFDDDLSFLKGNDYHWWLYFGGGNT